MTYMCQGPWINEPGELVCWCVSKANCQYGWLLLFWLGHRICFSWGGPAGLPRLLLTTLISSVVWYLTPIAYHLPIVLETLGSKPLATPSSLSKLAISKSATSTALAASVSKECSIHMWAGLTLIGIWIHGCFLFEKSANCVWKLKLKYWQLKLFVSSCCECWRNTRTFQAMTWGALLSLGLPSQWCRLLQAFASSVETSRYAPQRHLRLSSCSSRITWLHALERLISSG